MRYRKFALFICLTYKIPKSSVYLGKSNNRQLVKSVFLTASPQSSSVRTRAVLSVVPCHRSKSGLVQSDYTKLKRQTLMLTQCCACVMLVHIFRCHFYFFFTPAGKTNQETTVLAESSIVCYVARLHTIFKQICSNYTLLLQIYGTSRYVCYLQGQYSILPVRMGLCFPGVHLTFALLQ